MRALNTEHYCQANLVLVSIAVVRSREDSHQGREPCALPLLVHLEPGVLDLMASDDGQEVVVLDELTAGSITL